MSEDIRVSMAKREEVKRKMADDHLIDMMKGMVKGASVVIEDVRDSHMSKPIRLPGVGQPIMFEKENEKAHINQGWLIEEVQDRGKRIRELEKEVEELREDVKKWKEWDQSQER